MSSELPNPGYDIRQHLERRGWTPHDLAEALHRPLREINEIIAGYRDVTPEIAVGLSRAFDTTPHYWLNHQMVRDLLQTAADD